MATDDDQFILDSYQLISKQDLSEEEYEDYKDEYPLLESEDLYVLNKISNEDEEKLEDILAKPLVMLNFVHNSDQSETIKNFLLSQLPQESIAALQDKSVIEIASYMPEEQRNEDVYKRQLW